MADVLLAIGIDPSEAKAGRDQIVRWNDEIAASYEKVLAAAKSAGSQSAGAGLGAMLPSLTSANVAAEKLAATFEKLSEVARRPSAPLVPAISPDTLLGLEKSGVAARQSASAFKEQIAEADRLKQKMQELAAAEDTYAANRMRDMERIASAQAAQNAQYMRTDAAAQSFAGYSSSGLSAKDSASVFQAHFAEEARALEAREKAAMAVMAADMRRDAVAQKAANDDIAAADRAAASIMAGEQRKAQAAQKAAADQARSVANLTAAYAPHAAELQRLSKDEATINSLRKSGAMDSDVAAQALQRLHLRQQFVTAESQRMAGGAKLSAYELRNLSYQINDVVSGLAMGQSPMMILTQQGGQFVQIFQAAGISVGRIALGFAAVAAAGASLIAPLVHLSNMAQEARELDVALRAVGNTSGVTGARLQAMAYQTAAASMSNREDVTASFRSISTSAITLGLSPQDYQRLTQAAEGYAFVTGKTLPQATDALIKVLQGGYVEMTNLAHAFPMATEAELNQLRVMAEHGDRAGVLAKSIELLNRKFKDMAKDGASETQKAFHDIGTAWDSLLDKVSNSRPYIATMESIADLARKVSNGLIAPGTTPAGKISDSLRPNNVLSFPMPPAPQREEEKKAEDPSASMSARADAIMSAAQKEAAAYGLIGVARERAMVSAQYDRQIAEAATDAAKAAELVAQKRAALMLVDARATGQARENVSATLQEAEAQQRLADAVGKGYQARMAAERQNQIAAELRTNPYANDNGARELSIAAQQKATLDLNQRQYIDNLARGAEYETRLADARLKGAEALRKEEIEVEVAKQELAGLNPELVREAVTRDSIAKQRADFYNLSRSMSPAVVYAEEVDALDRLRKSTEGAKVADEQYAQAYIDAKLRMLDASREFADGAEAALIRYANDASNYGALAGNAVTSGMRSMENALVGFSSKTMTAAQAFKSMASSIIQDLIRMQVQAQITGPLSKAISGGLGGMFSSTPQTSNQLQSDYASFYNSAYAPVSVETLPAHASGTDYAPGGLSLVGEKGPEIMQVPGGSRIYPADETKAILSPKAANSNAPSGGTVHFAEGAIVVNAPGATEETAYAIAVQVAQQVVAAAAPQIQRSAVQQSVGAVQSLANRGGSFAQSVGRR